MARYRTVAYHGNSRIEDYKNDFDSLTQLKIRLKDIFMFDMMIDRLDVYDKQTFLYEYVRKDTHLVDEKVMTEIYKVTKEEQFTMDYAEK